MDKPGRKKERTPSRVTLGQQGGNWWINVPSSFPGVLQGSSEVNSRTTPQVASRETNLVTQTPWGWLSLLPCITPPGPSLLVLGYLPKSTACTQILVSNSVFGGTQSHSFSFSLFFPSPLFSLLLCFLNVYSTPPPVYLGDSVSQAPLSVRESEIPSAHCSSELWSLHHHITEGEEGGRGRERTNAI